MFRLTLASALLFVSLPVLACTETEAFGFRFGQRVPSEAKNVTVYYFTGGTGGGNVIRSFSAPVPSPLDNFPNYAYFSNRDRKVVHSIIAFRQLISDKKLLYDDAYRTSVLEKTKREIAELRAAWEERYGLKYTAANPSGLTWDAENASVSSTIGTFGGEYLYVECANKALRKQAEAIAWKSFLGK